MKITNRQYLTKEVNRESFNGNNEDQCIDMGIVHVFVNESNHWTKILRKIGSIQ